MGTIIQMRLDYIVRLGPRRLRNGGHRFERHAHDNEPVELGYLETRTRGFIGTRGYHQWKN